MPGLGPADARIAVVGLAPGRARRQPHRSGVHRRPQRRLDLRGALAGRAWPTSRRRRTSVTGWSSPTCGSRPRCAARRRPTRPRRQERDTCSPWLARSWRCSRRLRVIVVLGGFGWTALWPVLAAAGYELPASPPGVRARRGGRAGRAARPADAARQLPRQPAEHVHRPADRADAGRRPRAGPTPGSPRTRRTAGRPGPTAAPHGATSARDPGRGRRLRRPLHRPAAAAEAVPRAGGDHRRRPAAAHDLPAVPARGRRRLGRAAARGGAAAHDAAPLPGHHRRGRRPRPRGQAGPRRAARGRAVRGRLRRPRRWPRARSPARCRSPGWPSTASASRTSGRPSTCATTCWPGSTRQLHRRPRGPAAGAHLHFVGGGYAGVEAFAELEDMARYAIERYYPRLSPSDMRWVLVEAMGRILPEVDLDMARLDGRQLTARGMDVRLNTRLESISDDGTGAAQRRRGVPERDPGLDRRHEAQPDARRDRPARRRARPGRVRGDACRCAGCPTRGRPATWPPSPT